MENKITNIRVFISSTFQDMQAERNLLVEDVFPLIRKEAEERGIIFSYVDLRWGVQPGTDAEETIRICIKEIENCVPVFIGLIGDTLGTWIPNVSPFGKLRLDHEFSGIRKLLNKKKHLTEIEMRYNDIINDSHSTTFYYVKDGSTLFNNSNKRTGLLSTILRWFYHKESFGSWLKSSGNPIQTYSSKEFSSNYLPSLVRKDLMELIEQFPKEDRDKNKIRFSQKNRLDTLSLGFIDKVVSDSVKQWINYGAEPLCCITGSVGVGKSSAIAYAINKAKEELKIYHFVGSSGIPETISVLLHDILYQLPNNESEKYDKLSSIDEQISFVCTCLQNNKEKKLLIIDDWDKLIGEKDKYLKLLSKLIAQKNIRTYWCPVNNSESIRSA